MSDLIIKGIYRDRLLDAGGQLVFDSEWKSNLIVTNCRVLLAGFMRNEVSARGIRNLQVGQGDPAWDTTPPPAPPPSSNTLVDNTTKFTIPVANLILQYLNDSDAIVPGPTERPAFYDRLRSPPGDPEERIIHPGATNTTDLLIP